MDGTLDFNFQQGILGAPSVQVTDGGVLSSGVSSQSGTTSNATSAGVYVSTNAATPAAPPSWVH